MIQQSLQITRAEFDARAAALLAHVQAENLDGVVLFDNFHIVYCTGFAFFPTERPIAFVMNRHGEKALFVPSLEVEHARLQTGFARVDQYV
ncbi:MAG: aminopeptidase P family N-terminal domain-containing protein [Chloroflexota bacterium]